MADPYIDQFETLIYGPFAREQMAAVCLGKVEALDGMVRYAIASQAEVDALMKHALSQLAAPVTIDPATVAAARDSIVRFGSHIDSLKGRPVAPSVFFQDEAPSVVARRRLVKLVAAVEHIIGKLKEHRSAIRDSKHWIDEFEALHGGLRAEEKSHRAARVERAHLTPEVAAARDRWLAVYAANKQLVRGLLAHLGKPELMPLIFDDLAEVHRANGVSDAPAPGGAAVAAAQ